MANKKYDKSRFVPEPVSVWLGQSDSLVEYHVTPAPWGALFRLKNLLRDTLKETTDLINTDLTKAVQDVAGAQTNESGATAITRLLANEDLWAIIDGLLQKPYEFFKLAIPDLDSTLFDESNPNGATITQVWATFEVIADVNRLEIAKNAVAGRLAPPK